MSDSEGDVTRELAYTTARTILGGDDDDLRLGHLRLAESEPGLWSVFRREDSGGVPVEFEADVFRPGNFNSAQMLAAYLLGLAWTDEEQWPIYVPQEAP